MTGRATIRLLAAAGAVGLALLATAAAADPGGKAAPFSVEAPRSVHLAPDFSLPDVTGQPLVLRDLRPRIVVVNFWATWCGPCVAELPALKALAEALQDQPFALVPIDVMEPVARVQAFLRDAGLQIPSLFDQQGSVFREYGVLGLPTTFIVDGEGRLIARAVGPRAWRSPEAIAYFRTMMRGADNR